MFTIAILIGIYSYLIFSLGLAGLLYKGWVLAFTGIFVFTVFYFFRSKVFSLRPGFSKKIPRIFLILILTQGLINLIGALGPELSFDALWYHLTIPKIFIENHKIIHIPGGLLYYSDMPKLTEMIYLSSLSLFNEVIPKIVHFSFGVLTLAAIYKLARRFMNEKFSIIACLIFYGNLVVGWQSTTAYIDLARSFFELMALWGLINYIKLKNGTSVQRGWFIESAAMLGLAISTKLLSLGTLFIFLLILVYLNRRINKSLISKLVTYTCVSLYVVTPWFLFSLLNTGNPVYPFFSEYFRIGLSISQLNPFILIKTLWDLFTHSSDPISAVYLIFLPLIVLFYRKLSIQLKVIVIYFFLSLFFWIFVPAKESRYMLPALAAFSIVVAYLIQNLRGKFIKDLSLITILILSLISIFYRGVANSKFLPVITKLESKEHFLSNHLNFNFGDFYDTDGYFKNHIKSTDKVLLYGFHNLFYADFPFIDSSYVKKGDKFNYIAVQNGEIPERFKFWKLSYSNKKTHVNLYSLGGQEWLY